MCFQALNAAKQELRFLLVYLHGDEHQDTQQFCRYTSQAYNIQKAYTYSGTYSMQFLLLPAHECKYSFCLDIAI